MPRYEYKCPKCGLHKEVFKWIQELKDPVVCPTCPEADEPMKRLISCRNVICDLEPYFDENINKAGGEWVTSRQHRKQLMKKHNLYERG